MLPSYCIKKRIVLIKLTRNIRLCLNNSRSIICVTALFFLQACTTPEKNIFPFQPKAKIAQPHLTYAKDASHGVVSQLDKNVTDVVNAALVVSDNKSVSRSLVAEREQSLEVLGFDAKPSLISRATASQRNSFRGSPDEGDIRNSLRIGLQQRLIDFGRHASRSKQAELEVSIAKTQLWIEQNLAVTDALSGYVNIVAQKKQIELLEEHLIKHQKLRDQIAVRLKGGVGYKTEGSLIDIRIRELELDLDTQAQQLILFQDAFETDTELTGPLPENSLDESSFKRFFNHTDAHIDYWAPLVVQAQQELLLSQAQAQEARRNLFPSLNLEAFVETTDNDDAHGLELRFDSSESAGFAFFAQLKAANLAIQSSQAGLRAALSEHNESKRQLDFELDHLRSRMVVLQSLQQESERAVELFLDQLQIGDRPITDAINVYEKTLSRAQELIRVESDILLNRLNASNLAGTLAVRPEDKNAKNH